MSSLKIVKYVFGLLIVIAIIIAINFYRQMDRIESRFKDFSDMKGSESFSKGWIPDSIPRSSKDIFEIHDLDTNEIWIKFSASSKDLNHLLISHNRMAIKNTVRLFNRIRKPKNWWNIKRSELTEFKVVAVKVANKKDGKYTSAKKYYFINQKHKTAYYYSF